MAGEIAEGLQAASGLRAGRVSIGGVGGVGGGGGGERCPVNFAGRDHTVVLAHTPHPSLRCAGRSRVPRRWLRTPRPRPRGRRPGTRSAAGRGPSSRASPACSWPCCPPALPLPPVAGPRRPFACPGPSDRPGGGGEPEPGVRWPSALGSDWPAGISPIAVFERLPPTPSHGRGTWGRAAGSLASAPQAAAPFLRGPVRSGSRRAAASPRGECGSGPTVVGDQQPGLPAPPRA